MSAFATYPRGVDLPDVLRLTEIAESPNIPSGMRADISEAASLLAVMFDILDHLYDCHAHEKDMSSDEFMAAVANAGDVLNDARRIYP